MSTTVRSGARSDEHTQTGSDAVAGDPMHENHPGATQYVDDMIQMVLQTSTQWDGLGHIIVQESLYNGNWAGDITARGGSRILSIHEHRESFVGRGVLLDVPRHLDIDQLPPNFTIGPDLLEAICHSQEVEIVSGDIVLVRTGILRGWAETGKDYDKQMAYIRSSPGLTMATIPWLHVHEVSAVASDTVRVEATEAHARPDDGESFHCKAIVDLGMPLGEFWDLDRLASACAADRRYECFLVAPPLPIPGAVGSPLNPIAIR